MLGALDGAVDGIMLSLGVEDGNDEGWELLVGISVGVVDGIILSLGVNDGAGLSLGTLDGNALIDGATLGALLGSRDGILL